MQGELNSFLISLFFQNIWILDQNSPKTYMEKENF